MNKIKNLRIGLKSFLLLTTIFTLVIYPIAKASVELNFMKFFIRNKIIFITIITPILIVIFFNSLCYTVKFIKYKFSIKVLPTTKEMFKKIGIKDGNEILNYLENKLKANSKTGEAIFFNKQQKKEIEKLFYNISVDMFILKYGYGCLDEVTHFYYSQDRISIQTRIITSINPENTYIKKLYLDIPFWNNEEYERLDEVVRKITKKTGLYKVDRYFCFHMKIENL